MCGGITGEAQDFGISLPGCRSAVSLRTRWEPQELATPRICTEHLKGEKKEVEPWCWNYETMQNRGLRLQGIVFSSFREAVLLLLSSLCWPHGTRLAIGQKIISTGHELEISSWGMDPISNQSGGKEISTLFLVAQTAFGESVKSSYPEKIRRFKNEIRLVGLFFFFTLQTCKFWGFILLPMLRNGVHAVCSVQ